MSPLKIPYASVQGFELEQCSIDDTHMFIKYSPIGAHCHQQHAKKSVSEKNTEPWRAKARKKKSIDHQLKRSR